MTMTTATATMMLVAVMYKFTASFALLGNLHMTSLSGNRNFTVGPLDLATGTPAAAA